MKIGIILNHKTITLLASMMLLSQNSLAGKPNETPYQIIFSDNVTNTGGPNDLGPTGNLIFSYTDPSNTYKINFDWEIYVNGSPDDGIVNRTDPANTRIDALRISYIQGEVLKYGAGIEILGNLGGELIQNKLHKLVGDAYIPATYSNYTKATPTINLEYTNDFLSKNVHIYSSIRLPLISKYGILDFQLAASHTFKNLNQTDISTTIGVNMDCKKYPDLPEFKGYPIRDFQVCTPETKLLLAYKNFTFFWEIPLMNTNVQNSFLGLGYQF